MDYNYTELIHFYNSETTRSNFNFTIFQKPSA